MAHFREGGSKQALAAVLGIDRKTLYNWEERHKDFATAIEKGEDLSLLFWEGIGLGLATGQPGSAPSWIFIMKNRFNWRDKQELSGDKDQPVTVSIVKFGSKDGA